MTEQEVKNLAHEICYQITPITNLDRNDTGRVINGKKHIDGFSAVYPYSDYHNVVDESMKGILSKDGMIISDVVLYFVFSEHECVQEQEVVVPNKIPFRDIVTSFEQLVSEDTYIVSGVGYSKDISAGHFRVMMLAGYK